MRFEIIQGDDNEFDIPVTVGTPPVPYNLTGANIWFNIRIGLGYPVIIRRSTDPAIGGIQIINAVGGVYRVYITRDLTVGLKAPATYSFDSRVEVASRGSTVVRGHVYLASVTGLILLRAVPCTVALT